MIVRYNNSSLYMATAGAPDLALLRFEWML